MDSNATNIHLENSVRAQAELRLKLGFSVLVLMVFAIVIWGTSSPSIGVSEILVLSVVYSGYNLAAWYLARHHTAVPPRDIVMLTAIVDPIMLSCWLFFLGKPSVLFASFYLFTILGFGFRIGITSLRICQVVSMTGFSLVVLYSPIWRAEMMAAISHGVLLLIVPLYASSLIRNLHAARNHAERESKAKSQLLANVSHELRTPLTGIVSSAQLLAAETEDPAVASRAAAILTLSAALDGEIKHLLDLSKLQSGSALSEPAPFELEGVVRHVKVALEPIAARKNISLDVQLDPAITNPVLGYEHELISVVMNLAGNAVKFTDTGEVVVAVTLIRDRPNEYVIGFRVADTGIGIAPEHLGHIFEPFYQVEAGTTRKYGGTGLGTSIALEHVKHMGGTLQVDSQVGKGTVFWFQLHFQKALDAPATIGTPAPATEFLAIPSKHVLVADDHPMNLRLLQEMLTKDGHHVTAAQSGEEALRCLSSIEYDAVFLDFNMSDIDGARVFQIYRFGKIKAAPTFFITADTSEKTAAKLLATGASGLIHKPITFHKLRKVLAAEPGSTPITTADEPAVVPSPAPQRPPPSLSGQLKLVPPEYISPEAIENLREVNSSKQFLDTMLTEAIADIEKLVDQLSSDIETSDAEAIRHLAHSLKGVCLNVGAVRLASTAGKLMGATTVELHATRHQWMKEVHDLSAPSIKALNAIMERQAVIDDRM